MLYTCTHMITVGIKGLRSAFQILSQKFNHDVFGQAPN